MILEDGGQQGATLNTGSGTTNVGVCNSGITNRQVNISGQTTGECKQTSQNVPSAAPSALEGKPLRSNSVGNTGGGYGSGGGGPGLTGVAFTVNSTADAVDARPGDGICETAPSNGVCTLRAAIQETNALPGPNTINVPAGTYILTIPGPRRGLRQPLGISDITDDLTISGAGAANTIIDGGGLDTVFAVNGARQVGHKPV